MYVRKEDDRLSHDLTLIQKLKLRAAQLLEPDDRTITAWLMVVLTRGLNILEVAIGDHVAKGGHRPMTEHDWELVFQSVMDAEQQKLARLVHRLLNTILERDLPLELQPRTVREMPGTVEGRLEAITIHGERVFAIYDPITHNPVECHFAAQQLGDVAMSIGKRVMVTGTVRYDRLCRPLSVQAAAFKTLREQHELPQARDVEGLAVPAGVHPDDYLGRVRDGGKINGLLG